MTVADVLLRAGQSLCGRPPTLAFTRDACRMLIASGIPGSFVECGVAAGAHPAVMAAVLEEQGDTTRRVHLFDSFQGIPHAGPEDDEQPGVRPNTFPKDGALISTGVSAQSEEQVRAHLSAWGAPLDRCVFHRGWFQDTMPTASRATGPIAYLRLDGDLYESTRVCLEDLYPLVVPGGVVVIDDYLLIGCRRATDRDLASIGARVEIREIEGGGGPVWWVKT